MFDPASISTSCPGRLRADHTIWKAHITYMDMQAVPKKKKKKIEETARKANNKIRERKMRNSKVKLNRAQDVRLFVLQIRSLKAADANGGMPSLNRPIVVRLLTPSKSTLFSKLAHGRFLYIYRVTKRP